MGEHLPFNPIFAAEEMARILAEQIEDYGNKTISLTREEALITQGLLEGLKDLLVREGERTFGAERRSD